MDNKIAYGIIGVLSLLSIFGGTLYLSESELDNTYICTINNNTGIFYGGISGTGLTAYPYKENRTDYERCYGGEWIKLETYIEEFGSIGNQIIIEEKREEIKYNGREWICNPSECKEIK